MASKHVLTKASTIAGAVNKGQNAVRPVLSVNKDEARLRVINLYRAWYRQIPIILDDMELTMSERTMKAKLREMFMANAHVQDIRAIDMLVIKGQMELNETVHKWKQACHFYQYFRDGHEAERKPKDFIGKFLSGKDSE